MNHSHDRKMDKQTCSTSAKESDMAHLTTFNMWMIQLMLANTEDLKGLIRKVKEQSEKMGHQLSTKKTEIMMTGKTADFTIDRKVLERGDSFCLLGLVTTEDPALKKYDTDWRSAAQG